MRIIVSLSTDTGGELERVELEIDGDTVAVSQLFDLVELELEGREWTIRAGDTIRIVEA